MKLIVLVALVAGCSGPAKKPPGTVETPKGPGVVWASEPQPFHIPHAVYARAVVGDVEMISSAAGWITKLDLKTGKVLLDKRVGTDDMSFYDIEHLGNDKWIVVGLAKSADGSLSESVAFTVDGATLEGKRITLSTRPDKSFALPSVAVSTEGVAIGGRGLQLALYDPATWAVKTVLDPQIGWTQLETRGAILVANHRSIGIVRFDLSTNGQRKVGDRLPIQVGVGEGFEVITYYDGAKTVAAIYQEGKPPTRLPDAILTMAIDDSGKRMVTVTKTEFRIHTLPTGEITKRTPLNGIEFLGRLTRAGSRMVFGHQGVERLYDLTTGAFSAVDEGPTRPSGMAVEPDGTVLLASHDIVRMQQGKVIGKEKLTDAAVELVRTDDTKHYVTSTNERKSFQLRAFGTAAPLGSWNFSEPPNGQWITRDGAMVFDYTHDNAKVLARTKGVNLVTYAKRHEDADVMAVDPDGDALISLEGRVAVLALDGKTRSTLRVPNCEKIFEWGVIEIGGSRAITYSDKAIAVWDRTTGKLIGTGDVQRTAGEVLFVPKREEVLVQLGDDLHVWAPGKSLRTFKATGMYSVALSKDGKRLALGFHDGHVVVYDVDAWLALVPAATPWKTVEIPATCGSKDPLVPDPPEPEGVEGGEEGGVEGGVPDGDDD